MIKKYGIHFLILGIGLFLGYLFFGGKSEAVHHPDTAEVHTESWTCSMHPEIKKSSFGTCPLCNMDLVEVNIMEQGQNQQQFRLSETAMELANIETIVVQTDLTQNSTLRLSGTISSNEKTNVIQAALFDGRIEELKINNVGEYIQKGQYLGSIYSPELYAAQDKLLTSTSYRETHPKLYAASRNTLGLWKMTDQQIDEMIRTGKPLMNFPWYSDVSGTVTEVIAKAGSYYKEGDVLFKLSNLSTVWAVFDAYENQLERLKEGQSITITSPAFSGNPIRGKISFIEPILDVEKRTVSVRVILDNKNRNLKPGMFVEGTVEAKGPEGAITVPKSAVLWTGKRSLVYIKSDPQQPVFEMVEVTLGMDLGSNYEIIEGLSPGDEIVINGTFTLDAAAQLQGKKSMTSRKKAIHEMSPQPLEMENRPMQMEHKHMGMENIEKSVQQDTSLESIIFTYMDLKNTLVTGKPHEAHTFALELLANIEKVITSVIDTSLSKSLVVVKQKVQQLANTHVLNEQRTHFKEVSQEMVELIGQKGSFKQPLYLQHCPMADQNKGASWLSFDKNVLNPYFGESMLKCGTVKLLIP